MGYLDRYEPGETDELIKARTEEFISGRMSEAVYRGSIHGIGLSASERDEIVWAAKLRKYSLEITSQHEAGGGK